MRTERAHKLAGHGEMWRLRSYSLPTSKYADPFEAMWMADNIEASPPPLATCRHRPHNQTTRKGETAKMKSIQELAATLEVVAAQIKTEPHEADRIRKVGTCLWLANEMQAETARLATIADRERDQRHTINLRAYLACGRGDV